jgi:hypothetical protein
MVLNLILTGMLFAPLWSMAGKLSKKIPQILMEKWLPMILILGIVLSGCSNGDTSSASTNSGNNPRFKSQISQFAETPLTDSSAALRATDDPPPSGGSGGGTTPPVNPHEAQKKSGDNSIRWALWLGGVLAITGVILLATGSVTSSNKKAPAAPGDKEKEGVLQKEAPIQSKEIGAADPVPTVCPPESKSELAAAKAVLEAAPR